MSLVEEMKLKEIKISGGDWDVKGHQAGASATNPPSEVETLIWFNLELLCGANERETQRGGRCKQHFTVKSPALMG